MQCKVPDFKNKVLDKQDNTYQQLGKNTRYACLKTCIFENR